jgi:hypothetical protein
MIKNYDRIKNITTDQKLIDTITQLQSKHHSFTAPIQSFINTKQLHKNPLRQVKTYIEERWNRVVTNLIVNSKLKIYEHLWQAEIKLLQELQPLLQKFSESKEAYHILSNYEKSIKQNLELIDHTIRKNRKQQNVPA